MKLFSNLETYIDVVWACFSYTILLNLLIDKIN